VTEVTANACRRAVRLAYAAAMVEVGAKLPKLTLRDADERAVSLASLHAERPLAAIFLRHFG
jgi:hypothetical protein